MNNVIISNALRFLALLAIQVLVLDHIYIGGYLNPYIYVLFILLLPFETPGWLLLLSAFSMGLSVDMFNGTGGVHAAAATWMAFVRPSVLRLISSTREYEPGLKPGISYLGFQWFFSYSLILIMLHHFLLFLLEVFSFRDFGDTLLRTVLSSALSFLLVLVAQYLFYRRN
ncbi:MAG TPA: hypothetical protein PLE85_06785 [Bacteroidales bacterium]|nr:hypothetical protein [Lentimicrobiaceae bacterium]HOI00235.1 hypothetical protein [Bacteroidales bacterium]